MDQNFYSAQQQANACGSGLGGWGCLGGLFGNQISSGSSSIGYMLQQTPLDNDWHDYIYSSPPRDVLCKFSRDTGSTWMGYARDFHPEFNVAGLCWRLTGIGKHQLGLL